jgi:hypothetical protein
MAQSPYKFTVQSRNPFRLLGRRVFGNRSTQTLHGGDHLPETTNVPPTSQKKFKKSNDAQHDISVLAMTYILHDNPTIQELIRLIITLHDRDDGAVCSYYSLTT